MRLKNLFINTIIIFNLLEAQISLADNHNIYETLELIQKDIKTLEKAVYSGSIESQSEMSSTTNFENNSEDVLTRHLLKLSEIENQFQELTNKCFQSVTVFKSHPDYWSHKQSSYPDS